MEKITIKNLIEFKRKNDKTRITFINNLKNSNVSDVEKKSEQGGDYWISCISALASIFKTDNKDFIREKNEYLQSKVNSTSDLRVKQRFQKNIDLLSRFEDFDFNYIKPKIDLKYYKKPDEKSILRINGLPIQVSPNHVFSYVNNDIIEIGAVWFIAQKNGFAKNELAIFCDMIYRYLSVHYPNNFIINPNYCVAVDVFKTQYVNYNHILNNNISSSLENTVEELLILL